MLSCLFSPVIFTAPISLGFNFGRDLWCRLLVWTLETAGPAFIKWGQWAAARPDLLPRDICDALSDLHSNARAHSFAEVSFVRSDVWRMPTATTLWCALMTGPTASPSDVIRAASGARALGPRPVSRAIWQCLLVTASPSQRVERAFQ